MRPIPKKLKEQLASDDFMKKCALCEERLVEWHHVFIYAGRQISEAFAIVPACRAHHDQVKSDRRIKEAFERIALSRATDEELARYPKKDWNQLKRYLNG